MVVTHRRTQKGGTSEPGSDSVRLGLGRGWWVIPDAIVFPIVVGRKHEWVGRPITGDGIREWFDDRRRSTLIGVAQSACPAEHAVLGLMQCPAALALQSMVMTTGVTEVGPAGRSALGVVKGVVLVGASGGARQRSWCRTVPDFQVATQRGTGDAAAGVGVLPTLTGADVAEVAGQVGHHVDPAA